MSYTHIPPQLIQRIEVSYRLWDYVEEKVEVPKTRSRKKGFELRRRHFVKTKKHTIFDAGLVGFDIYDYQIISGSNRGGRLGIPLSADTFTEKKEQKRQKIHRRVFDPDSRAEELLRVIATSMDLEIGSLTVPRRPTRSPSRSPNKLNPV